MYHAGYCDIFSKCRLVNADGPLSRIKQAAFNPELYSEIRGWIVVSSELLIDFRPMLHRLYNPDISSKKINFGHNGELLPCFTGWNSEGAAKCCMRRLLGTHQWQSKLLVEGLPVSNLHS